MFVCLVSGIFYLFFDKIVSGNLISFHDHNHIFFILICRWSVIAAQLPGRTEHDIKNYWNTKLKKKLMGLQLPISHQRKSPFPPPNSSHLFSLDYFSHTPIPFTNLEPISLPSNNNNNYANTSFTPFYQNQEYSMISVNNPMQYNYPIKDNMFMFGSEGSCSSSDGSCTLSHGKEIKQEENIGYHHMSSNGFDDYNNNFMISCNNGGENINQYEEKSSGVGYTNGQSQTLTPLLDYGLEDIKQLICSNNKGFNVDEIHKIEENGMYYYHY